MGLEPGANVVKFSLSQRHLHHLLL